MNIKKMRRYSACTTPDRIEKRFDTMSDRFQIDYQNWLNRFCRDMKIKHKDPVNINVIMDEDLGSYVGEVLIKARVVLDDAEL